MHCTLAIINRVNISGLLSLLSSSNEDLSAVIPMPNPLSFGLLLDQSKGGLGDGDVIKSAS